MSCKPTATICNSIVAEITDTVLIEYRDTPSKYQYILDYLKTNTDFFTNERNITLFENAMIRACVKRVNTGNMNKNNVISWCKS